MLLVLLVVPAAAGAVEVAGKGFSFKVPENWITVTRDKTGHEGLDPATRDLISRIDMSKLEVMVFDPTSKSEQVPNISFSVQGDAAPVNETNAKKAAEGLVRGLKGQGLVPVVKQTSVVTVAGRDAIRIELTQGRYTESLRIRQVMVFVPGGRKTYMMCCTVDEKEHPAYEAAFEGAIASLSVEPVAPKDDSLSGASVAYAVGTVLGAAFLLYILWRVFAKPKRPDYA